MAQLIAAKDLGLDYIAMIDSVSAIFQPTEEKFELFIEIFVGRLPKYSGIRWPKRLWLHKIPI